MKVDAISSMVKAQYAWRTILDEITKCDVRCSNCHKLKTAESYGWYTDLDETVVGWAPTEEEERAEKQ